MAYVFGNKIPKYNNSTLIYSLLNYTKNYPNSKSSMILILFYCVPYIFRNEWRHSDMENSTLTATDGSRRQLHWSLLVQ